MKIKIAVLYGGRSVEHEISIISAIQAMGHLNIDKYEIFPVYITKNNELYYGSALQNLDEYRNIPNLLKKCKQVNFMVKGNKTYLVPSVAKFMNNKPIALIDVAFPIVHGTNVEDGSLQGYVKMLNLPYVGSNVLASAVCMDKYTMKLLLKEVGIPVLDSLRFELKDNKKQGHIVGLVEKTFAYPVIVKPVNLGSSVGIGKASNFDELEQAIDVAFSFAERIIIEPAVVHLKEVNCSVLGDAEDAAASECEEPITSDEILSYSDKYLDGGKKQGGSKGMASLKRKIPADITQEMKQEIQNMAIKAFKFLDCNGVCRIDFLVDTSTNQIWLNEINAIPGSLSFYLWEPVGVTYGCLLDNLIQLSLKRQRKEDDIVYSFDSNVLSMGASFGGSKGKKV